MARAPNDKKVAEARSVYSASARRRSARPDTSQPVRDWEWIQANRPSLEEQYAGRWVAVHKQRVVGVGVRLSTAVRQAKKARVEQPFLMAFKAAHYRGIPEVAHWL